MAFNLSNPYGTGTDAELLEFTRAAYAHVVLHGWYRGMDGEIVQHAQPKDLLAMIERLEARINADTLTPGQKTNYARRNRPA